MPRFLWLATGGKSQINDRLLVLKGRKVVAFPDVDGYDEWLKKLAEYPELGVTVSPVLQQNATAADREVHIDIADWLLRYMFGPLPEEVDKWHLEFLKASEFIAPEHHAEVEAMIHDLELEFWGAIKIDPPPEEASTDTESAKNPL